MSGLSGPGSSPPPEDAIRYHASAMRAPRWLLAISLCFLARAFFYADALPLFAGYDEGSPLALPSAWALQDSAGNLKTYEGLQAPLAAWIMTPVLLAARHAHLATQILLLRWISMSILSLVIPLTFLTAHSGFRHDG